MKSKLLLSLLGIVFTGYAVTKFVGKEKSSNVNSKESKELVNISKQYSVKILFKNESKKIASWKSELNKEKIEFSKNKNLPNEKIMVNISNEFGTNISFDLDSLNTVYPLLKRMVSDCDTTILHGIIDKYCVIAVNNNITILNLMSEVVYGINRFTNKVNIYKLNDSLVRVSYKIRYGDDSIYRITKDLIKNEKIQEDNGFVVQYYDKDTLCLLGKSTVITTENVKDTNIKSALSVYRYYNGKCIEILPVVANGFIQDNYFVPCYGFIYKGDKCYFILSRTNYDLDNKIIGVFERKKNKLIFSHISSENLPEVYIDKKLFYKHCTPYVDYPYFSLSLSNNLYNIEDHTVLPIKDLFLTDFSVKDVYSIGKQRSMWDMKIDKQKNVYYIIVENGKFYYVKYDMKQSKVTVRKNIAVQGDITTAPVIDRADYNYVYYCKDSFLIRKNIALF